jgi:hypothetical protein
MNKLAIVGDKKWHDWLLSLSDRFIYAHKTEFIPIWKRAVTWEWLQVKSVY